MRNTNCLILLAMSLGLAPVVQAIELGQRDTFDSGTANWAEGQSSPNPPTVVTESENVFLQNLSNGTFGPGGRLVMFNRNQWTGDFLAAGVSRVTMDLRNETNNNSPLYVRLSLSGANTQFSSTEPFLLNDDGNWHSAVFDLNDDAMALVFGSATLSAALASVDEFRILSAQGGPAWIGDAATAGMAVDNILATQSGRLGDLTGDGVIDAADAGVMFGNWGQPGIGDLNSDQLVDAGDAGILFANWTGDASPGSQPIPEPCLVGAFLVGCILIAKGSMAKRWG